MGCGCSCNVLAWLSRLLPSLLNESDRHRRSDDPCPSPTATLLQGCLLLANPLMFAASQTYFHMVGRSVGGEYW